MSTYGFYNQAEETMPLAEVRRLQEERLRQIVRYVWDRNPVQRQRFEAAGVTPDSIRSLDDLTALPLMNKEDFRRGYPLALSCVDRRQIVEMHMSSGSTGTPVVMPYTPADLRQWGECMARCYRMAGVLAGDVVQLTPSFGLFNGGFGFYHGAQQAGLFVLPTGAGNTARQVRLAKDFKTRVFTGVVSYGTRILEELEKNNTDLPDMDIAIFGAEIFSESMKEKIAAALGVEVFDIYGMTESGGVGTLGMDCFAHQGLHVWEDHYIIEIIDPKTAQPVADGERGELVVTALTRIVSREPCACGRTHVRIESITGRLDDMIIVKGVNFFPSQVEHALMEIPGVKPHYQIIIEDNQGVKDVRINVEAEPGVTGYMVEKHLKEALGFSPKGDVFKPGELPRQEGKAQRVFYEKDSDK